MISSKTIQLTTNIITGVIQLSTNILSGAIGLSSNIDSKEFQLELVPAGASPITATLTASGSVSGADLQATGKLTAALTGAGTISGADLVDGIPDLTWATPSGGVFSFATHVDAGADTIITLFYNGGGGWLQIDNVSVIGTDSGDFTIASEGGTNPMSPGIVEGGSYGFDLRFDPTAGGVKDATLRIECSDPDSPIDTVISAYGEETKAITATLTAVGTLTGVDLKGTGKITSTLTGAGTITEANLKGAATLTASLTGAGTIDGADLEGTGKLTATLTAAGNIDGANLTNAAGGYDSDKAFSFDGSTRIDFTDWNPVSSSWSLSCWIKLDTTTGDLVIISNDSNANNYIAVNSSTVIRVRLYSTNYDFTVSTMSAGTWYHLGVTRNGGTVKVYLDGTESSSSHTSTPTTGYALGRIGERNSGDNFQGDIDDFVIWESELTSTNMTNLYNSGNGKLPTDEVASPVRWYKMDSNVNDSGSDAENGTVTGTATYVDGFTT